MTFGTSPFGSAPIGSKISSHAQWIEQLNTFINTNGFFSAILSIFHRRYAKTSITVDNPDVVFDVKTPTIEANIF